MNPVVKVALPLAVLAAGIGIYATLVLTRPEATVEPTRGRASMSGAPRSASSASRFRRAAP